MLLLCVSLTFLILITLLAIWWYKIYFYYSSGLKDVPSPLVLPLIGTAWQCANKPKSLYKVMVRNIEDHGLIVRECIGPLIGLVAADPDFIQFVTTNTATLNKAKLYNFLHNWLGTGLLTSRNSKWRSRRKLLTPAYHFKILEQFINVFDTNGAKLVKKLKSHLNEELDAHPLVSLCALDIISETAMGTSINAQDNEYSDFVIATKQMTKIMAARLVNPIKVLDLTYRFTADYKIEKKAVKVIHDYTDSIIKIKRREMLAKQLEDADKASKNEPDIGIKKRIPFLDLLLQSSIDGEPLSDEDIKEEVDTFMFEGHDTVSTGTSFCLYLISKHPEIQSKILTEQREIFGDDPQRPTTYKDLQDMKYLEMAIKEGLRLFPPVPVFGRILDEDVTFKNIHIKKNTEILIAALALHRHEKFYPNPEVFDPERFTLENQAKRHPFSYIPFSSGFRNCIGQKFAMLELKSLIGKLVRNFEICEIPNYEVDISSEIILSSVNGVKMIFKSRNW